MMGAGMLSRGMRSRFTWTCCWLIFWWMCWSGGVFVHVFSSSFWYLVMSRFSVMYFSCCSSLSCPPFLLRTWLSFFMTFFSEASLFFFWSPSSFFVFLLSMMRLFFSLASTDMPIFCRVVFVCRGVRIDFLGVVVRRGGVGF